MSVAFLGTGLLGSGFVEGFLTRGVAIRVWNRTAARAAPLVERGATLAHSPAEAVAGVERVHLCLAEDTAVDSVIDALLPALAAGTPIIDHTTTSPAGTAARCARLDAAGVVYQHAPVFMGPANARDGSGIMLASGPKARFDALAEALTPMSGRVWWVGERPDLAACYKLFGNAMIIGMIGTLADVFTIAQGAGVSPEDVNTLFAAFNPAGIVTARGPRMARGKFSPASFELVMARKDVRLMVETAAESPTAAPLAVLPGIAARMDDLVAAGFGQADLGVLAHDAVPRGPTSN